MDINTSFDYYCKTSLIFYLFTFKLSLYIPLKTDTKQRNNSIKQFIPKHDCFSGSHKLARTTDQGRKEKKKRVNAFKMYI